MIDPTRLPRGIRNNNPGNIRLCKTLWQGEAPTAEQTDGAFIVFTGPVWGLRAIAKILLNYQRQGLHTVRQMISRWAPPNENDTDAYVRAVASEIGIGPDEPIDLQGHTAQLAFAVEAIVRHENGAQPYTPEQFAQAVHLAITTV